MGDELATAPPPPASSAPAEGATTPKAKRPKRHILLRLFGIGPWSAVKLAALCVLVGSITMVAQFDPADPEVNAGALVSAAAQTAYSAAIWTAQNFWRPALAGATIVLPIWVLWRLVSLPFRR
ncbi:MAG: hypothetical protein AAFQ67_02465 [Pseudomonadota bacterium]